jgi:RNA polymerase sigma-70 factor (ECF subfamily)
VTLSLFWFFSSPDDPPAGGTRRRAPWRHGVQEGESVATQIDQHEEAQLVRRIRAGDTVAFDQLFLAYYQRMWVFAYELIGSRESAEEIVQDVFAGIWTRRAGWEVLHGVPAYLFGAVRNRAYKQRRHGAIVRRFAHRVIGGEVIPAQGTLAPDPVEELTAADLLNRLEAAIERMPVGRRTAMLLRWREQLSYDEIAQIMGTSVKAVSFQLAKAREELRLLVEKMI